MKPVRGNTTRIEFTSLIQGHCIGLIACNAAQRKISPLLIIIRLERIGKHSGAVQKGNSSHNHKMDHTVDRWRARGSKNVPISDIGQFEEDEEIDKP